MLVKLHVPDSPERLCRPCPSEEWNHDSCSFQSTMCNRWPAPIRRQLAACEGTAQLRTERSPTASPALVMTAVLPPLPSTSLVAFGHIRDCEDASVPVAVAVALNVTISAAPYLGRTVYVDDFSD